MMDTAKARQTREMLELWLEQDSHTSAGIATILGGAILNETQARAYVRLFRPSNGQ